MDLFERPIRRLGHHPRRLLAAQHGAGEVQRQRAVPLLRGQLEERHDRPAAGIGDEDVQLGHLGPDRLEEVGDGGPIRRVGGERDHGLRRAGAGPQLLARVLQRLHASGDHHDVGAGIDEAGGDAEADPLAGARDRRPLPGEWSVLDVRCS